MSDSKDECGISDTKALISEALRHKRASTELQASLVKVWLHEMNDGSRARS